MYSRQAQKGHSLLLSFADLLLRGVLDNEGVQLVPHINIRGRPTGFALEVDVVSLDFDLCLRITTGVALNILLDEAFKKLQQLAIVMCTVYNRSA